MPDGLKVFLTVVLSAVLTGLALMLLDLALWRPFGVGPGLLVGLVLGFIYGLFAGVLQIYDLNTGVGWVELLVDLTWSLPNTLLGLVIGVPLYLCFGNPSRAQSTGQAWISFAPRGIGTFGNRVLQTLGNVNLGGPGQHERMHLLQARIFGPLYLPLFAVNYVVTGLIQMLWTGTIGLMLWLAKARAKPYFEPPATSAVSGFFGWIYHATFFELWAYASGNP